MLGGDTSQETTLVVLGDGERQELFYYSVITEDLISVQPRRTTFEALEQLK